MAKQTQETQDLKSVNALLDALKEASSLAADKAAKAVIAEASESIAELLDLVEAQVSELQEQIKAVSAPVMRIQMPDGKHIKLSKPASKLLPKTMKVLSVGKCPMIKGPSGCGKTVLASQVAEALECEFFRIVISPDMGISSLFGKQTEKGFVDSPLVMAVKRAMAGERAVLLVDEMDTGSAECLVMLNALFEDAGAVFYNPMTSEKLTITKDLFRIACVNTWGKGADHVYTGRNRLDAATLNRFALMSMDYCLDLERSIALQFSNDLTLLKRLQEARTKLRQLGSDELVSTRAIESILTLVHAEMPEAEAIETVTASWPDGLAADVGLAG
jgi:cobaltochelatase CobS